MLRQVLDGEAQPARTGRAEHQPVGALRETLVRQRLAEHLVVDAEVVDVDARLRHAGGAAGLEDVDRLVGVGPAAPSGARARRAATRPGRRRTCRDPRSSSPRRAGPSRPGGAFQPEGRPGLGGEMPPHHLAHPSIQPVAGTADIGGGRRGGGHEADSQSTHRVGWSDVRYSASAAFSASVTLAPHRIIFSTSRVQPVRVRRCDCARSAP